MVCGVGGLELAKTVLRLFGEGIVDSFGKDSPPSLASGWQWFGLMPKPNNRNTKKNEPVPCYPLEKSFLDRSLESAGTWLGKADTNAIFLAGRTRASGNK